MDAMNPNIRLKNGHYFVEDTMSDNAFIHVFLGKNPMNVNETRVTVIGKKEGVPPADYMPITEKVVYKLQRMQNLRKREQFLGW